MRILVINPNSNEETLKLIEKKVLAITKIGLEFKCIRLHKTPKLISTSSDCNIATTEVINAIKTWNNEVDAFIIACYSDPGLNEARKVTEKPVIGIAEASMRMAYYYGNKFAIISPTKESGERKIEAARKYYSERLLHTIVVPKDDSLEELLEAGKNAVSDGANVLLLGCGNYVCEDKWMEKELGVPVLDGLFCAVVTIENLICYNQYKDKQHPR